MGHSCPVPTPVAGPVPIRRRLPQNTHFSNVAHHKICIVKIMDHSPPEIMNTWSCGVVVMKDLSTMRSGVQAPEALSSSGRGRKRAREDLITLGVEPKCSESSAPVPSLVAADRGFGAEVENCWSYRIDYSWSFALWLHNTQVGHYHART